MTTFGYYFTYVCVGLLVVYVCDVLDAIEDWYRANTPPKEEE